MTPSLAATLAASASILIASATRAAPTPPADGSPPSTDPPSAPEQPLTVEVKDTIPLQGSTATADYLAKAESISSRGVAEDFLVLPDGADLGGRLRMVTADDGLGVGRLKLTDLALMELDADWAFARSFELDAAVSVLAKQPSATREPVLQGGSLTVRRDLFTRTAAAVSGAAAPLLGVKGLEFGAAAFVTHKHRLNEFVAFALAAGASSTFLRPTNAQDNPYLFEAAGNAAIHVGFKRFVGGWMGAGYAIPVVHGGHDPVSGMSLDPQPRLDLNIGGAVRIADDWDLSVELSIIDRGDAAAPATRLPILDGGFDQIQLSVGVTRRVDLSSHSQRQSGVGDPMIHL